MDRKSGSYYNPNDISYETDYDGHEHAPDVQVSHATSFNGYVKQKHIALTADASDSDDDDYSDDEDYPCDTNYHRTPLEILKGIKPEEYKMISEGLTFTLGPAPIDDENPFMNGRCHQKKSYKILVSVPPYVFPPELELVELLWKENPRLIQQAIIPTFSYVVLLYLGTISRIVRAYQPAFISTSKRWWQPIRPSNQTQELSFDVQFTDITTRKLKNIPFRVYAQLQVSSSVKQALFRLLSQGCSPTFAIYSHSRQYGYTPPTHCPLCKKKKDNVVSVQPEGFKKKDGSRKYYHSLEHRFPAWRRDNHGSSSSHSHPVCNEEEFEEEFEDEEMTPQSSGTLKILAIFPIEVLPGDDMSIIVSGISDEVERLFFGLDGEDSLVDFARLHSNSNVFVGTSPVVSPECTVGQDNKKKRFYIRNVGESPYELLDVPESDNSFFLYKTLEDVFRSFGINHLPVQAPPSLSSLDNCFQQLSFSKK